MVAAGGEVGAGTGMDAGVDGCTAAVFGADVGDLGVDVGADLSVNGLAGTELGADKFLSHITVMPLLLPLKPLYRLLHLLRISTQLHRYAKKLASSSVSELVLSGIFRLGSVVCF